MAAENRFHIALTEHSAGVIINIVDFMITKPQHAWWQLTQDPAFYRLPVVNDGTYGLLLKGLWAGLLLTKGTVLLKLEIRVM